MDISTQINELAASTFEEIQRIEKEYHDAEEKRKETPQRTGWVDAAYQAKAMKAEAEYLAAKDAYNSMRRNLPGKALDQLAAIRREYVKAVGQQFAVDPKQIDANALELLRSGIMKASEYSSMMENAKIQGNYTMVRLIARYAADAAEEISKKYGEGDPRARELRAVSYFGNKDPEADKLGTFDNLTEIFRRTVNNSAMISYWGELATPFLEML